MWPPGPDEVRTRASDESWKVWKVGEDSARAVATAIQFAITALSKG